MFTAVISTRIFCTSQCPAQPPRAENVIYLESIRDCLGLGCRPCKRCKPMHVDKGPYWLSELFTAVELLTVEEKPVDELELRKLGLTKQALGRWFSANHQFTFDAYLRMRRLARELGTTCLQTESSKNSVGRKKLFQNLLVRKQVKTVTKGSANPESLIIVNRILTPLGPMVVCADDESIILLEFADRRMLETQICRIAKRFGTQFRLGINGPIRQLDREMNEYFAGKRQDFSVVLNDDGTDFQNAVWKQLQTIEVGQTKTYGELAIRLDKPNAVRAVGRANGDNRLTILVPCHRLVGADGSLTGYGGGLDRKQWLLEHENKMAGSGAR